VPLDPQQSGRLAKARVRLAANLGEKDKKAEARKIFEAIVAKDPNSTHGQVAKRMLVAMMYSC